MGHPLCLLRRSIFGLDRANTSLKATRSYLSLSENKQELLHECPRAWSQDVRVRVPCRDFLVISNSGISIADFIQQTS